MWTIILKYYIYSNTNKKKLNLPVGYEARYKSIYTVYDG